MYGTFEGRGWDVRPEEDVDSLSVGFYGGSFLAKPNEAEIGILNATVSRLISDGVLLRKLRSPVKIICETVCLIT